MSGKAVCRLIVFAIASCGALHAGDINVGAGVTVEAHQSAALPISLASPAAPGGVYISVTSSDTNVLTVSPATVIIREGATVPAALPRVFGVNLGSVTISASAYGMSGDSQLVRVAAVLSGPASIAIERGSTQNVTLSTSGPSGINLPLSLTSPNPAVASAPSSATIPAGSTSVTIPISANGAGNTAIRVSGTNLSGDLVINVAVTAPGQITIPSNLSIAEGQSVPFPVTLSSPAPPPGVAVSFTSSDSARVSITPASVFIAGGAVTPSTQPRANGLNIGGALITASAPGYGQTTQAVAVPATLSFSPASLNITSTEQGKFLLALSASAPWDIGLTVQMTSSNPSVATVQPTIDFYPDGSAFTTVVVVVTPHSAGTAVITAGAPPYIPAALATVTVGTGSGGAPASVSVLSGDAQTATVNTPFAAPLSVIVRDAGGNPAPGAVVTFTAPATGPGAAFSGPATAVSDASGIARSVSLVANGIPGIYTVAATVPGVPQPAVFGLTNASGSSGALQLQSNVSTGPSQAVVFPVSLSIPAPAGGVTVTLSSSDPSKAAIAPSTTFIPGGATAPAAQPSVTGVNFGSATISATAPGYSSASQVVLVKGTLTFSPPSLTIRGTGVHSLALALSAPAPASGLTVSLSSDNPGVAAVPGAAVFAPGATSVDIPVTGAALGATILRANTAAPNVTGTSAVVTVQAASDISIAPGVVVEPGHVATIPVSLATPAPAGGVYISLASGNTAVLDVNPSFFFIPEGSVTPVRQPQITGKQFGSASVSASAAQLAGDSQTVRVAAALLGPSTATVDLGSTQNLTFVISTPAPAPVVVTLSSDNPAVASVPATITIPAGGTTVFIPVFGASAGSASITAGGAAFISPKTVQITVTSPGSITLPANITVSQGQSVLFPVTLGSPASGYGVNVTLNSSDPSRVTVSPSAVFVPAGATAPPTQPRVSGHDIGASTISASAPGYISAIQTVSVPGTVTFSPSVLTMSNGPAPGKLLLALSASAPWGSGLTVNLSSSNPNVATVPPTINFYPDGSEFTTIVVLVTSHGPGTTVIRASAPPYIPETSATVIVQ